MKNLFNSIKMSAPKSNAFDLTHDVKLSCDMGQLVPCMVMECVPSDRVKIGTETLVRFAPLVSPVMHRMDVSVHYFFVPNRILWENWEKWITRQDDTLVHPYIEIRDTDCAPGELADYLGLNAESDEAIQVSAFPHAAYQKIYNDYYRSQDLQAEVAWALTNGSNSTSALNVLRNRGWEHDYFTAALPFAQRGSPVTIPSVTFGDVPVKHDAGLGGTTADWEGTVIPGGGTTTVAVPMEDSDNPDILPGRLYADTSSLEATAPNINDLRRAFRLQEWLEKNARAGIRYFENILAHFGMRSPDSRLQRPEYITGLKSPVVISEVLNTTGETLPQGNMAGHGISVTSVDRAGYYTCQEHGYIIGIMSVMPKTAYMQGIPRHFLKRNDPFRYFWPAFANIGEQEVEDMEIYATQGGTTTFGYVPRYAEYKFLFNRVSGDFKSTLEFWHMARKFAAQPSLNATFIESDPTKRIFAVETGNVLYCHVLNKVNAIRPMPVFGTPTF